MGWGGIGRALSSIGCIPPLSSSLKVGDASQSMAQFKSYLESRGAVLAQNQEFATYCALPYIPDPTKHPSFKSLFSVSSHCHGHGQLVTSLPLPLATTTPSSPSPSCDRHTFLSLPIYLCARVPGQRS